MSLAARGTSEAATVIDRLLLHRFIHLLWHWTGTHEHTRIHLERISFSGDTGEWWKKEYLVCPFRPCMHVSRCFAGRVDLPQNVSQTLIGLQNVSQIPVGPNDPKWRSCDYYGLPFIWLYVNIFSKIWKFSCNNLCLKPPPPPKGCHTHTKDVHKVEREYKITKT